MVELMARVVDGTQKTVQSAMCSGLTDWTQRLQLAPSWKRKRCAEQELSALYCDSDTGLLRAVGRAEEQVS